MTTPEILPCPFCGWDAPYVRTTGVETEVYCQNCTAVGPLVASGSPEEDVDSEALRLWNRRANTATIKGVADLIADQNGWVRRDSAVLAELPEVRELLARVDEAVEALDYSATEIDNLENVLSDYRGNGSTARIAAERLRAIAAAIREGRNG